MDRQTDRHLECSQIKFIFPAGLQTVQPEVAKFNPVMSYIALIALELQELQNKEV